MRELRVFVRDSSRRRIAEIDTYSSLEAVVRHTGIGGWRLTVPFAHGQLLALGAGIDIELDGSRFLAGPVTAPARTYDGTVDTMDVVGACDSQVLADRLVYPDPSTAPPWAAAEDVRTGPAETVLSGFVDANLGSGALGERQEPLIIDDLGRGATVTGVGRLQRLVDLVAELALAGGDLGVRVVQEPDSTDLRLVVTDPATRDVTFSADLGNLAGFRTSAERPTGNVFLAGGPGDGLARTFTEASDAASTATYGRIEGFVDVADESADLAQAANAAVTAGSERVSVAFTPIDIASRRYQEHYDLSDRVTVVVDGVALSLLVREVQITADETGVQVFPTLATPDRPGELGLIARLRRLERQAREQERR